MSDNFIQVDNSDALDTIFSKSGNKLVILLFITKHNTECRRAKQTLERCSSNHRLVIFCVVETDNFDGKSRFLAGIDKMPKIDGYYNGNMISTKIITHESEIETFIRSSEQIYMQSISPNNCMNGMNGMGNMNGMNNLSSLPMNSMNMNMSNIKNSILNNAKMTNPVMHSRLLSDPQLLDQLCKQQMLLILQNQKYQPNQQNMMQINNMSNNGFNNQFATNNQNNQINQNNQSIPSYNQLIQMFQIFQMMNQMGIINMEQKVSMSDSDNVINLPNGDKIVTLSNNKYGLIRKKN